MKTNKRILLMMFFLLACAAGVQAQISTCTFYTSRPLYNSDGTINTTWTLRVQAAEGYINGSYIANSDRTYSPDSQTGLLSFTVVQGQEIYIEGSGHPGFLYGANLKHFIVPSQTSFDLGQVARLMPPPTCPGCTVTFNSGIADPGSNGIVVRTATNVTVARSIAFGANLSVSNADGVDGNPTISLGAAVPTSVVNDTNIQGGIAGNVLTFTWAGTLAKARQHPASVYTDQNNTFGAFIQTFQAGANHVLVDPTDTSKKMQLDLSGITTGNTRTVKVANGASVTVIADAGASNNFLTGIDANGNITKAQPAFSNLSGSLASGQDYNTGVSPGTYSSVTVNGAGRVTGGSNTPTLSGATLDGNLIITGNVRRITGPFDNATDSNRPIFQSSTTNSNSWLGIIPNGTNTLAGFISYNANDADNASAVRMYVNGSNGSRVESFKNGTGTLQKLVLGQTGAETVLRTSLTTPASVTDGDWWVECTGTSPSRICAIKVRDGGVTRTIASLTF
jgi:hypothetical protein